MAFPYKHRCCLHTVESAPVNDCGVMCARLFLGLPSLETYTVFIFTSSVHVFDVRDAADARMMTAWCAWTKLRYSMAITIVSLTPAVSDVGMHV